LFNQLKKKQNISELLTKSKKESEKKQKSKNKVRSNSEIKIGFNHTKKI
jgi:hypothetical protein